MRRSIGLSGIALAMLLAVTPQAQAKCNFGRCGDLNDDCQVDIGDVVVTLRASVGLEQLDAVTTHAADVAPATEIATRLGIRFAETVGNDAVDIGDAVLLMRRVIGLEAFVGCFDQPDIRSIDPLATCGSGTTTATAVGERLCWNSPAVFVDGEQVAVSSPCNDHRFITFQVPDRAGVPPEGRLVDIVVRSTRGAGLLRDAIRLLPPCSRNAQPESLAPGTAPADDWTRVTLSGADFHCLDGARLEGLQTGSIVELTNIVVVSETEARAYVPRLPFAVDELFDLIVTSGCEERALQGAWRYQTRYAPSITSLRPVAGGWRGGEAVVCAGHNLQSVTAVRVGDVLLERSAVGFGVASDELRIFSMPPSPTPGRETQVAVVPLVGEVPYNGRTYSYGANNVIRCWDVIETTGPVAGGTLVGIDGDDLRSVEAFLFGGVAAPDRVMLDDSRALVVLPRATGPGTVRIGLQRGGVVVDECDELFTYE